MGLTLYLHPLASFCHKVLIALNENETSFVPVTVDLADAAARGELAAHWPLCKIPVLHDSTRRISLPETSIIIEYLHQHYRGAVPLLPDDPAKLMQVRLWDRFFDLYVSQPMQKIVTDRIRPAEASGPLGVEEARAQLATAYAMSDRQLSGRDWAAGDRFSLADCAAAPALFYAAIVQPFGDAQAGLRRYFERLAARPSVARTLAEARPYFSMFPYREAIPARFLTGN